MVNNIDRLRRHAELRHERIERDDLFLLQSRLRNQIIKLNAEHDLALRAELRGEFLRHRAEVLLLVKRLPEKFAQLGINRFRIIVTQKAKARVDLFLEQNAVRFGKTGQHLDQKREQVRSFRNTARPAQSAPEQTTTAPSQAIGKRRDALHRAIDSVSNCGNQLGHEISEGDSNFIG